METISIQLTLFLVAAVVTAVPVVDYAVAKPGCQDSCGNASIFYPFGTHQGCYLDRSFWVTCDNTTNTLYLDGDVRLLSISLDGQLRFSSPIAKDCYSKDGNFSLYNATWVQVGGTSSLAYSRNKFIVVGCDTDATIRGYSYTDTYPTEYLYSTGCKSYCYTYGAITNGSCSGVGCCELSIPQGAYGLEVTLGSYKNHSEVKEYNPCSYAFIVEDGFYDFNSIDLVQLQNVDTFPVVFDWTIGNSTCAEAKRNRTAYACKDKNSVCFDSDKRSGYLCNCSAGFHGNPYLSNGCKDNDECANPSLNDCISTSTCQNTNGSYICICHEGYYGDGRKNGFGCRTKFSKYLVIIGVSSGLGFLLLISGMWLSYKLLKRRKEKKMKQKFFKRNGGLLLEQQLSSSENHVEQTKLFSSNELEIATDHYHVNRILGQGGQGTVYKGMLTDGRVVAIKKSKVVDKDKLDQFINEVVILSQINHRNVVKLFGCCLETEVPMLVYEFIPNGTLSELLHGKKEQEFPLSWGMRLQIAAEVAGAISYLHSSASMPIYHRDIKTSNILLDEKYRAKVADFGTSRSISTDDTHVTTRVQGTFGYLDPEYFRSNQFTDKSDVYSFGVVLVELLTGEKAVSVLRTNEVRSLVAYFLLSVEENRLFEIVDGAVLNEGKNEEIVGMAELAKSCLNLNGKRRPNMKTVAMELERIRTSGEVCLNNEQEFDEVDYDLGGYNGPWEATSSSSKSMHSSSQPLFSANDCSLGSGRETTF